MWIGTCMPKGIPLDEDALVDMTPEERTFWRDFLQEAKDAVEKREKGERFCTPPPSLKVKFQTAITRYRGGQYCQVQALLAIFSFQ